MTDVARAAVLTEFGKPLEIREFPILGPEPGGLVVTVEAATVCGTDVHNWQGHTSSLKPPVVPGHEGVGRIIAFGDHAEADSRAPRWHWAIASSGGTRTAARAMPARCCRTRPCVLTDSSGC